jgi:hypothetical protein
LRNLWFCFSFFFIRSGVSLSFHLVRCFVCVCVCTTLPFFLFCYYYFFVSFCFVLVTILEGMRSDEKYV